MTWTSEVAFTSSEMCRKREHVWFLVSGDEECLGCVKVSSVFGASHKDDLGGGGVSSLRKIQTVF